MNCSMCGSSLIAGHQFCQNCGNQVQQNGGYNQTQQVYGNGLTVGYSYVINAPEMKAFIMKKKKGVKSMYLILLAIVWIGFPIFSIFSDEMGFIEALAVAGILTFVVGGINIFSNIKNKKRNIMWEGQIVDKRMEQRTIKEKDDEGDVSKRTVNQLILYVKRFDTGKVMDINLYNKQELFDYYNVGDNIKHHADTYYYEKYDKTRDYGIICVNCGGINGLENAQCKSCKMPLLK